jgi:hypothetical protein
VTDILSFTPATEGFSPRVRNLAEAMPLVLIFSREPDLLPFVRHLFHEHRVFTVADWDNASPRLLDTFGLSKPLQAIFKKRIGRPQRAMPGGGRVVALHSIQRLA